MTHKEALEYLKNRVSTLALNHKIGSRDIAKLEVKEIVRGIETYVIPTLEKALEQQEQFVKDVARFLELMEKPFTNHLDEIEYRKLKEKLMKAGEAK